MFIYKYIYILRLKKITVQNNAFLIYKTFIVFVYVIHILFSFHPFGWPKTSVHNSSINKHNEHARERERKAVTSENRKTDNHT